LGDISAVEEHISDALDAFHIDLRSVFEAWHRSPLNLHARPAGHQAAQRWRACAYTAAHGSDRDRFWTLKEALEGRKKEHARRDGTVQEYGRAIDMFVQILRQPFHEQISQIRLH
jgi:hypothetical protein